jgi:hypothetical protein
VLILDGAGWHGANALVVPDNLSLLTLPPYSPELNPVENIWQYLRANWLAISVFESYGAIVDACCAAWNALRQRSQNRHLNHLARLGTGQLKGPLVSYGLSRSSPRQAALDQPH